MDFTITINDAFVTRMRAAFGHWDNAQNPPVWVNATAAEVRTELKRFAGEKLINYESTLSNDTKRAALSSELTTL